MKKHILKFLITNILLIIVISCSEDSPDDNSIVNEVSVMEINKPPIVQPQSFNINENIILDTFIGTIEAQDPENNKLEFTMVPIEGLVLDINSGNITTEKGSAEIFDFETEQEFEFEVSISDEENTVKTKITLLINDIEDGPLTNFEKDIVEGFKVQVLANNTDFPLDKKSSTAKIFYSGAISTELISLTESAIKEFNEFFTDGFKIEIGSASNGNVELFTGSKDAVKNKWSDFVAIIEQQPNVQGIATIGGGRIWIDADTGVNSQIIKHEIGHMIGLFHAPPKQCGAGPDNSLMCGGGSLGNDFSDIDIRIMEYYYHPELVNGLDGTASLEKLTELILLDR